MMQTNTGPRNKIAVHWARKIANRKIKQEYWTQAQPQVQDGQRMHAFEYTGQPATKVFMLPNKSRVRVIHKILLKHKLRGGAREMNIVPGLHSTLVSVPKIADKDYIVVFDKKLAKTYDAKTATITATAEPVLKAPQCTLTGLWLMPLKTKMNGGNKNGNIARYRASNIEGVTERANTIFELPSTHQTILYHHASARFPIKETFLNAVRAGNYATWPGLTIAALHKYFPDLDEMQKGHMKGQQQGIHSTKQKALDHLVESEKLLNIKVEPGTEEVLPAECHNNIFVASTPTKQARFLTPCSKAIATS